MSVFLLMLGYQAGDVHYTRLYSGDLRREVMLKRIGTASFVRCHGNYSVVNQVAVSQLNKGFKTHLKALC